jgi:hypothetical protein
MSISFINQTTIQIEVAFLVPHNININGILNTSNNIRADERIDVIITDDVSHLKPILKTLQNNTSINKIYIICHGTNQAICFTLN